MISFQLLRQSFEKEFQKEIQSIQTTSPIQLYEPVAYSLVGGGKRIRPVLLLHAASLFSENPFFAYPAAFAIELFHNFTLLHDDIMDHAAIRRGIPTVHVRNGENSAILSGDAMSIMAFRYLAQCNTPDLTPILSLFSTTALEVCEGQQYDMEFEKRDQVTIAEYLEMIRLKTAVLIACSLKMGALLAGANAQNCQLLYEFGILIGIAFQLQDDWLDVYGDEHTFGKQIGGDICENKKSCLLITALALSNENDRKELQKWIACPVFDRQEKIEAVRKIYTQSGADASTRNLMNQYYTQAMEALQKIEVETTAKTELQKFAAEVMSRVK